MATREQKIRTSSISIRLIGMLSTIKLHHQTLFETAEVGDERADHELTAEFKATELSGP